MHVKGFDRKLDEETKVDEENVEENASNLFGIVRGICIRRRLDFFEQWDGRVRVPIV